MRRSVVSIAKRWETRKEVLVDLYIKEGVSGLERVLDLKHDSVYKIMKLMGITSESNKYQRKLQHYRDESDKPKCRDVFSEGWNEMLAYFVGYFLGDGSLTRYPGRYGGWKCSVVSTDEEVISKFSQWLGIGYSVRTFENRLNRKPLYGISCSDRSLYEGLSSLGFVQNKSDIGMRLPQVPDKYFWDFVRGLQDSDGSVYVTERSTGRVEISMYLMGHKSYMRELEEKLSKWFVGRLRIRPGKKDLYELTVGGVAECREVFRRMYSGASVYLTRKKRVWDEGWLKRSQHIPVKERYRKFYKGSL